MLTSLRIQNFRSIRDASVKLGQVNLFIGPNNSGKSNFLKGISLLAATLNTYPNKNPLTEQDFTTVLPRLSKLQTGRVIGFKVQLSNEPDKAVSLIIGYDEAMQDENRLFFTHELKELINTEQSHKFTGFLYQEEEPYLSPLEWALKTQLSKLKIYKIEPSRFEFSTELSDQSQLEANGFNITSFLFTLSQNYENIFTQLRTDFAGCVGDLNSISTPPDPVKKGRLRLKFFDSIGSSYWAEEVSEGVLYFLALLCIVHQPDPPKLLLLEEPEKGIHPRRIKEVMDFIFDLARLRDIQIIFTSHSPYVVDYFADIPECISVFDRENGETVIHNAGDIISETNDRLKAAGGKPIRYTDSLGEHWVSGFLGGVPL